MCSQLGCGSAPVEGSSSSGQTLGPRGSQITAGVVLDWLSLFAVMLY